MNVAVCLSGCLKYPEYSLKSIKKIIPNENIKIFIHTWDIANNDEYVQDSSNPKELLGLDILKNYSATDILIENYSKKRLKFEYIYDRLKMDNSGIKRLGFLRHDVGVISMYYSIFRSNQLKCKYEKENNIIFDKVIRMRFDSNFFDEELILDKNINQLQIPCKNDWGGINDQFAIGPSDEMDNYSNLYRFLLKMDEIYYHPETLLKHYLDTYPLKNPINRFSFEIGINSTDYRGV